MVEIDWSGCPIVQHDPEKLGGVPTVRAWRLSADAIVENHDDGMAEHEIAEIFENSNRRRAQNFSLRAAGSPDCVFCSIRISLSLEKTSREQYLQFRAQAA